MRLEHPTLGTFDGSPEEIARLLADLRAHGVLPTAKEVPGAPNAVHVEIVDARPVPRPLPPSAHALRLEEMQGQTQRLRNAPNNELLLHEYRQERGIAAGTLRRYGYSIQDFERKISPKSLLDATQDDVRAYERDLLDGCKHLVTITVHGRERDQPHKWKCRAGQFPAAIAKPGSCCQSCPLFRPQTSGPAARLKGLKHFYDYARFRGLVLTNPVELVAKRHARSRARAPDGPRKYGPSVDDVRALIRAALDLGRIRDAAFILGLAKRGRRPWHESLVRAEDLRGVGTPWSHVDFHAVRERVVRANRNEGSKLSGNLIAPVDAEHDAFLREVYLPHRQREWGYSWEEGVLYPRDHSEKPWDDNAIRQSIMDPLLRHLRDHAETPEEKAKWQMHHDASSRARITAGTMRHFMSTQLKLLGVPLDDRQRMRGDRVPGAHASYEHLEVKEICARYPRTYPLLLPPGAVRVPA